MFCEEMLCGTVCNGICWGVFIGEGGFVEGLSVAGGDLFEGFLGKRGIRF